MTNVIQSSEPMVSVLCTAYNQKKYIKQCLESFVNQKTTFPFEIIIHDDASDDGTSEIIKEYSMKYPDLIKPIFQTVNQFSQKKSIYANFILPLARGKYVATCEGDDFWIDEYKLQKQFDVMERDNTIRLCVHKVSTCEENGEPKEFVFPKTPPQAPLMTSEEFIKTICGFWSFQTSSYFMRSKDIKAYYSEFPEFGRISPVQDICWMMYLGNRGKVLYIDEPMSCYRVNAVGSWSVANKQSDVKRQISTQKKFIETWKSFDDYTQHKYHEVIEDGLEGYAFIVYRLENDYRSIIKNCRNHLKKCSWKMRVFIYLSAVFPFIPKIYEKV